MLIIGVGNILRSDEGIGIHALKYIEPYVSHINEVSCIDGGTLSFDLLEPLSEAEWLIVIDAAQLNKPAGTVERFIDQEMDRFLQQTSLRSVHDVSLIKMFSALRLLDRLPKQRALIGIQPASLAWGDTLSHPVHASLTTIANTLFDVLRQWKGETFFVDTVLTNNDKPPRI